MNLLLGRGARYTHRLEDNTNPRRGTPYDTITLDGIRAAMREPQLATEKAEGWWFCPTGYVLHDARDHGKQRELGQAYMLVADIDRGDPPLDKVKEICKGWFGDHQYLIYSSPSRGEVREDGTIKEKWRVLFPLARPLPGASYADYQMALEDLFEKSNLTLDKAMRSLGQPVYLPNAMHPGWYEFFENHGPALDVANHPISTHAAEFAAIRAEAVTRDIAATDGKASFIGHFRRKHSIEEVMSWYPGFEQSLYKPELYRWQGQQTQGYGSIRIMQYPDREEWVSKSDTFNMLGIGRATVGNSRAGDSYDIYKHFQGSGPAEQYARQIASAENEYWIAHGSSVWESIRSHLERTKDLDAEVSLAAVVKIKANPEQEELNKKYDWDIDWPPGLAGNIAQHLYNVSARPVKQFAIAQSLHFCASLFGRRYSALGHGINLYCMLAGDPGSGKGESRRGVKSLYGAMGHLVQDPGGVADLFDHDVAVSSSGLRKLFTGITPSISAFREDADSLLESLMNAPIGGNGDLLRASISTFYDASGDGQNAGAVRASKIQDSAEMVSRPSLTLGLDFQIPPFKRYLGSPGILSSGFGGRWIYFAYYGPVRYSRKNIDNTVPPDLLKALGDIWNARRVASHEAHPVKIDPEARIAFEKSDDLNVDRARDGGSETMLINRAHMNAMRVAANVAIGISPMNPVITKEVFEWSNRMVNIGYNDCMRLMSAGEVGAGERVRVATGIKAIKEYVHMKAGKRQASYKVPPSLAGFDDVICESYFLCKLKNLADFKGRDDAASSEDIVRKTLGELVRQEYLVAVTRDDIASRKAVVLNANLRQPLWLIGQAFYE